MPSVQGSVFHKMNLHQQSLREAKFANGKQANLCPDNPYQPQCVWESFLLQLKGEAVLKGWGIYCPGNPARPCMCPFTAIFSHMRKQLPKSFWTAAGQEAGGGMYHEVPARDYGKPAQNPSQAPTQVLEAPHPCNEL